MAISGLPPIRSESAPAIGATNIGMIVHGSTRSPDSSGEKPCAVWKNCVSRKIEPNIPKYMRSDAAFAAANARLRKKRIGSIGCGVRSSQPTKAASPSAPIAREPRMVGLVQPSPFPWIRPHTTPSIPTLANARPGRSSARSGPVDSLSWVASGRSTMPTGTFSQKIHCQEIPSTTAPPTSGPIATARPAMPDQAPSAAPRRSRETAALRSVSVSGVTIAAPNPWTARAAISQSADGASAAAAEAAVKIPTPSMNIRFRPNRSPSAAPVSRKTAKVRVYAFTVHSSSSREAPRSTRITGIAVETTRLSSTTMKSAIDVIANVQMVRVPAFIGSSFSCPSRYGVVIDHSFAGEKREMPRYVACCRLQPSSRRATQASVSGEVSSRATSTFSSIPVAKNLDTVSRSAPETVST